jgi:phosphatidate cytidylyltransferase
MNNLSIRIISGTVYVVLVVLALHFGQPWFSVLLAIFTLLGILESISMNDPKPGRSSQLTAVVYAGILVYLTHYQEMDQFSYHFALGWILQVVTVFFIYRSFLDKGRSGLLLDTLYIWIPLFALAVFFTQTDGGSKVLLFYFICLWSYDSFAYLSGRAFGRTALFPKVSPKKTREGALGGLLLTAVLMYILNGFWLNLEFSVLPATIIIIIFATLGDFFESYYKRQLDLKDSGNIMPGHGGILDRIDSLLFSCLPFITYMVYAA